MNPIDYLTLRIILARATQSPPSLRLRDLKAARRWTLAEKYKPRYSVRGNFVNESA